MTDKIELTVLGCGSSFGVPLSHNIWGNCDSTNPKNYRTRPSIYLKKGDKSILIDTSPDLRHQLITNKIDTLDAVIFTHAHADHTHGINDLRSIALINKKKIPVFADKNSLNTIKNSFSYLFTKNDKHGYEPILQKNIIDNEILDQGIGVDNSKLKKAWDEIVDSTLKKANLNRPEDGYMASGSKKGIHTEHLGFLLAEMQFLPRAYPDAKW